MSVTSALLAGLLLTQAAASASAPPGASSAPAQERPKPLVTLSDSLKWEGLGQSLISPDGRWHAARVSRVDGSGEVRLRSVDGPEKALIPEGNGIAFSDDSLWMACLVGFSRVQTEQLQEQRRRPEPRLALRNLATGEEKSFEKIARWSFLEGGSHLLILHLGPAPAPGSPPPAGGSDFVSLNLKTGETLPIASVSSFFPNKSGLVALVIESSSGSKALQVLNPKTGSLRTLAWGKADLRSVRWAGQADSLAWMESVKDAKKEGDSHVVKVAQGFSGESLSVKTLDLEAVAGWPKDYRVSNSGVSLSSDGKRLVFVGQAWKAASEPAKPSTQSAVEVWNSKDSIVMPLQRGEQPRGRAVWWDVEAGKGRVVSEEKEEASFSQELEHLYVTDVTAHAAAVKINGFEYADIWHVNLQTGERTKVLDRMVSNVGGLGTSTFSISTTGRYAAWFEKGTWRLFNAETKATLDLKAPDRAVFVDDEDDRTLPEKPPVDTVEWTKGDRSLFLPTKHDLYQVTPSLGRVVRATQFEKDGLRVTLADLDTDDDYLDESQGLTLNLLNTETMASGVGRLDSKGARILYLEDRMIFFLRRSKGTDRVLFRRQSFEDPPDDFVTNMEFSAAKPMTRMNPQQKDFAWGKSELIRYKTKEGKELKGILLYPANYQPGLFYPMLTYIYERQSMGFHAYRAPSPDGPYNVQNFVQKGYFVLLPDIAYRKRDPGLSAQDCVESAVRAAIQKRVGVDPARVGLTGHSWGGYQTVFLATQSKMFKAYAAGAPLTELISMYSGFYFNWGQTNQVIFESSQGRMEVPFWEDLKAYIENSPLYHAQRISAPMMVQAGTADGAVDWTQSQFLYNTLRRMGKELTLLLYPGENHNVATLANRRDYARRLEHFFDVHLKGVKPEPWLEKGVPFTEIGPERTRLTGVPGASTPPPAAP